MRERVAEPDMVYLSPVVGYFGRFQPFGPKLLL